MSVCWRLAVVSTRSHYAPARPTGAYRSLPPPRRPDGLPRLEPRQDAQGLRAHRPRHPPGDGKVRAPVQRDPPPRIERQARLPRRRVRRRDEGPAVGTPPSHVSDASSGPRYRRGRDEEDRRGTVPPDERRIPLLLPCPPLRFQQP